VEEALRNNREILAAQKKVEALRQRPARESSLPDPTLSLGWTSNGGPWPGRDWDRLATSNIGVMVSQEVPAPGKRKLRGEIADKEAAAAFSEYLATRLSVVSRLKQAYHELHHAAVAIFRRPLPGTAQQHAAHFRGALRGGPRAQQDILRAQTQLAIFAPQRVRFEQDARRSRSKSTLCSTGRRAGGSRSRLT
jgi:outer membrane protein, heavy metal efflux system